MAAEPTANDAITEAAAEGGSCSHDCLSEKSGEQRVVNPISALLLGELFDQIAKGLLELSNLFVQFWDLTLGRNLPKTLFVGYCRSSAIGA